MNEIDENELILRLQKNDREAFMVLYDRYHVLIYQWVLKLVKVPHLAEDLVQEVFLKIWKIREHINPQQSFPAFLYRISRNMAFNTIKKIASEEKLQAQVMTELRNNCESAENKLLWQQYEEILRNAVEQLPKQRQKVFKLCRTEGKTYEEVAQELGISRNTVKEHMVLAVKNIKEYFYRYGDISFLLFLIFSSHS